MYEVTTAANNIALVVPFANLECKTILITDIWKRSEANLKAMLEEEMDRSNQSNFRTGEVVILNCLHNIPYSRVYFIKTPNNEGLPHYLLDKLFQSVKKLIERAEGDTIKRIYNVMKGLSLESGCGDSWNPTKLPV
jgi:hypothetical protein